MKKKFPVLWICFMGSFGLINPTMGQILAPPIYYCDFIEGIPNDWTNESATSLAEWEYRGPDTDPDLSICSRGSCGASSIPITSLSQSNGFVIFDSNYWDDDDGVCGGLGTGQDPAPHLSSLITGSIDLSNVTTVVLTFQQQFKHYQSSTKVYVSSDGGGLWTQVLSNPGVFSPTSEWKTINITSQAAGYTDVKIKFEFSGTYYWWLLDDIALYSPNPNDLQISSPGYSQYGIAASPILFNDMMYHAYPQVMIPPMKFSASGTNIGGNTQTQVKLFIDVKKTGITTTYSNSSVAQSLSAGQTSIFQLSSLYTTAPQIDEYFVYYNLDQLESDDNTSNNLDTLNYFITDHTYARDRGGLVDVFVPQAIYAGQAMEVGNVFQARANNLQFSSIAVGLGEGTTPGANIYGIVWNLDRTEILGITDPHTVNIAEMNSAGEEQMTILQLQNPITLLNDSLYLVMVGIDSGDDLLRIGRSGPAPAEASLVRYPDSNGLFYMLTTPMVRMNIFPSSAIPGCMNPSASNYNASSTADDESCLFPGCTIFGSFNYSPTANWDDGTCIYCGCSNPQADNYDPGADCDDGSCIISGCTDPNADNYNPDANLENNTCLFYGCTNPEAANYDQGANLDDGTCLFPGCTNPEADNFNPQANLDDGSCIFYGCTHPLADNFDADANVDDGSCILSGCTDPAADNYWNEANNDDGTCLFSGCTDPTADNFNPGANLDDGSCIYFGCTDPLANNYDDEANVDDLSCLYNQAALAAESTEGCAPFTLVIINQTQISEGAQCLVVLDVENTWTNCEATMSATIEAPGTYFVSYTYVQGESISTFDLGPIEVFANPEIPLIEFSSDPLLSCQNCTELNIQWYLDGTALENGNETTWQPLLENNVPDNGYYYVSVETVHQCAAHSDSILVLVPYISASQDTSCIPTTVFWTNLTDPVASAESILEFGDTAFNEEFLSEYSHEYTDSGDFTWIYHYGVGEIIGTIEGDFHGVAVPPEPIFSLDNEGILTCTNLSETDSLWWDVNGVIITDEDSIPVEEGANTAYFLNEGLCGSENTYFFSDMGNNIEKPISFYPNPSRSQLMVQGCQKKDIFFFDSRGAMVYKIGNAEISEVIDVSQWSTGLYYALIHDRLENSSFEFEVVK